MTLFGGFTPPAARQTSVVFFMVFTAMQNKRAHKKDVK
jgi:hypothetical protein